MKKIIAFLMVAVLLVMSTTVFAYRIGDVIGTSLTTDIVAQINGYDIASYNYQGYTYVIAEDLANYGFTVSYDNYSRTLSLTRNYGVSQIYSTYKKPAVSSKDVGKKAFNLLYTDIKTYIDGKYVNSYNINGQTIIAFDDLAGYGSYIWDNNTRKITLDMPGIEKRGVPLEDIKPLANYSQLEFNYVDNYGTTYEKVVRCPSETVYLLDGKYSKFQFTSIPHSSGGTDFVKIWLDDKLVLNLELKPETKPQYTNLNISGCNKFKIQTIRTRLYNPVFK